MQTIVHWQWPRDLFSGLLWNSYISLLIDRLIFSWYFCSSGKVRFTKFSNETQQLKRPLARNAELLGYCLWCSCDAVCQLLHEELVFVIRLAVISQRRFRNHLSACLNWLQKIAWSNGTGDWKGGWQLARFISPDLTVALSNGWPC